MISRISVKSTGGFVGILLVFIVVLSITAAIDRQARACPPTVRVSGDRALVAEVTPVLLERGIATTSSDCPEVAITVERRGRTMVVATSSVDHQVTERVVTDSRTAATVIESWVRTDVEAPLLERRRLDVDDDEQPGLTPSVLAATARPPKPGLPLFTLVETGVGSDRTTWFGVALGGCVRLGPLCAGGRLRLSTVAGGPGEWRQEMDRQAVETLVGVDVPMRVGRVTLSPGIAAGVGWIHTQEETSARGQDTTGVRAESHLALSYPLGGRISVEGALSLEVGQTVHVETASTEALPSDPRALVRAGLGLRFEGP
jgi:hypothetical protein